MHKTPVVMLIVTLIGGSLAVGAPAAFATLEGLEGLGNNDPAAPLHRPAGPVAKFAVPAATSGVPVGSTGSAVSQGHAELK